MLILTVTILFGIQAPLCAFACADATSPEFAAVGSDAYPGYPAQTDSSQAPCHESKSDPAPSEAPGAHEACGCDFVVEGLLSSTPNEATVSIVAWMPPESAIALFIFGEALEASKVTFAPGIPPPDILLLKSTLLI